MKTLFYTTSILFLTCVSIVNAQTPFDNFDSTMAQTPIHKAKNSPKFIIPVQDSNGKVAYLQLDIEEKQLAYYNGKDSLVDLVALNDEQLKFLSVDPLTSKYPYYSPYHFAGNAPIEATDLDGLEPNRINRTWNGTENSAGWNPHDKKYNDGWVDVSKDVKESKLPVAKLLNNQNIVGGTLNAHYDSKTGKLIGATYTGHTNLNVLTQNLTALDKKLEGSSNDEADYPLLAKSANGRTTLGRGGSLAVTTVSTVSSFVAAPVMLGYSLGASYFAGSGFAVASTSVPTLARVFWWYGQVSNANTYYGTFSSDGNGFLQNTGAFIADKSGGNPATGAQIATGIDAFMNFSGGIYSGYKLYKEPGEIIENISTVTGSTSDGINGWSSTQSILPATK